MKRVTSIATAIFTAVLLALAIGVAAQDFNTSEKTFLTFSGAVEMPGMTLKPGTYTFRLADTPNRNVVQVLSQDEKDVLGQFLFIQKERMDVTGETVVTFKEASAGTTPAIQYWFYPGEKIGKEFIYPKDQALKIAKVTGVTVLTEEGRINAEGNVEANAAPAEAQARTEVSTSASSEKQAEPQASAEPSVSANPVVENPPQATVAVGTSGAQNAQENRPVASTGSAELPRTASPLALSGLLGLLSLAGAFGLRVTRHRRVAASFGSLPF